MEFKSPDCIYCHQIYSKYNEPILIVCLCEESAKYAHGSCFRDYLVDCAFGVCNQCFTKTRIVTDGYKRFSKWKFTWKPFCGFWKRFKNDNSYWKIVYCREIKHNKKTKIEYEDVPIEVPWKKIEEIEEKREDECPNTIFETESSLNDQCSSEEGESDAPDEINRPISRLPTVYKPRGYPFVKRQQDESALDSSFEYFMNASHRDSFNSGRNLYLDDNSIYTITTETNESASEACSISEDDDKSSTLQHESKLRTIGRSFIKKLASEKTKISKTGDKSTRKSSNNNTVQQFSTINEMKTDEIEELSVSPARHDVIFMDQRTNSLSFKNDLWKGRVKTIIVEDDFKKSDKDNKKSSVSTNTYKKVEDSKRLYGLSTTMFPRTVSTSAPEPKTLTEPPTLIGLIDKDRKTNIFYSPS